jgi:Ca2+-binding RTX toxin-like protein
MATGTPSDDFIKTWIDADYVDAGDGNDVVKTRNGNNTVLGGAGDDLITTGRGDDSLDGGDGNDIITDKDGDNTVLGGAGNDVIKAGRGDDSLDGGDGNDIITDKDGDNTVLGGAGDDLIRAGRGDNLIEGGDGNDALQTKDGNDAVLGGAGDDLIKAGQGDDVVEGGAGNDLLTGGAGLDSFFFSMGFDEDWILDFENGSDTLDFSRHSGVASLADLTLTQVEKDVVISDAFGGQVFLADTSLSDIDVSDFLFVRTDGTPIADNLSGGAENDSLNGGDGNDTLNGGDGNDTLDGGDGDDTADYGTHDGEMLVNLQLGTADFPGVIPAEVDTLIDIENVIAGSGDDTLTGDDAANGLAGGDGNDTLVGAGGNDTLPGGAGIDVAMFAGSYAGYGITSDFHPDVTGATTNLLWSYRVADTDFDDGDLGTDILQGVEEIRFADLSIFTDSRLNPPILSDDALETDEDTALTVPLSQLRLNDEDFDRLKFGSLGLGGTVVLDDTGTLGSVNLQFSDGAMQVVYDPGGAFDLGEGESATDTFTYTVDDGSGGTDGAIVTVTVTGLDDPEVAVDDNLGTLRTMLAVPELAVLTESLENLSVSYVIPLESLFANDAGDAPDQLALAELYQPTESGFFPGEFDGTPAGAGPITTVKGGTAEIVGTDVILTYTDAQLRAYVEDDPDNVGDLEGDLFQLGYGGDTNYADVRFRPALIDDSDHFIGDLDLSGGDGQDGEDAFLDSDGADGEIGSPGASWSRTVDGTSFNDVIIGLDSPDAGKGGKAGSGADGADGYEINDFFEILYFDGGDGGTGGDGGDGGDTTYTIVAGDGNDMIIGGNAGNGGVLGDPATDDMFGGDGADWFTIIFHVLVAEGGEGGEPGFFGSGGSALYIIDGGVGDDYIVGGVVGARDSTYRIQGGEGDDEVWVGPQVDTGTYSVEGGGGNDVIHFTQRDDDFWLHMDGGADFDQLILHDTHALLVDQFDLLTVKGQIDGIDRVTVVNPALSVPSFSDNGYFLHLSGDTVSQIADSNVLWIDAPPAATLIPLPAEIHVTASDLADWTQTVVFGTAEPEVFTGPEGIEYHQYINGVTGSTLYLQSDYDLL